ncbi:MAG: hypothetical protein K0R39_4202 [Symbiobacteriaceae bacterium]|nr:hypothetical protein [Symbiobacteriaceae bacterium]
MGALAVLLFLLALTPQPSPWSFVLVGAGCLVAVVDGYAGVWLMLRRPRRARRHTVAFQMQVCVVWLVNTLAFLTLLNTSAELAVPGTFLWRDGPASLLDVAYLTTLTFASGGYGDIRPGNELGKLLTMLTSLAGLIYATLLVTAIWQQFSPDIPD